MTTASPEQGRRRPIPWGLLGMIALVAVFEARLARRPIDFITPIALEWRFVGEQVTSEARGCDVLCFGDSLVKYGVAPQVLERRLGRRAYNLAIGSGRPASSYFLLRRALAAGARPSAVLIDGETLCDAAMPSTTVRLWSELLSVRETFELAWAGRDATFFAATLASEVLPSVRARYEARANVVEALRGNVGVTRYGVRPFLRNWHANRGAQVLPKIPTFDVRPDADKYHPVGWACDPVNEVFLHRFLRLAADRNIRVFWLMAPVCPEIQARRAEGGAEAEFNRYVRGLMRQYPNLTVLDARFSGYSASVHIDATHLDSDGVAVLSADVAPAVAEGLRGDPAGPRWIMLPPFGERPPGAPIENVAQSQFRPIESRRTRIR